MENNMKIIKNESRPESIYSNGVSINCSIFETRIEFLKDTIKEANGEVFQEVVADIRVSPQLAKTLALFLLKNIEEYEKQFGGLPAFNIAQGGNNE